MCSAHSPIRWLVTISLVRAFLVTAFFITGSLVTAITLQPTMASAQNNHTTQKKSTASSQITALPEESIITFKQIDAERATITSDLSLDEENKKKAFDLYDQAIAGLKEADGIQAMNAQILNAPNRIAEIRNILSNLQKQTLETQLPTNMPLDQIEFQITDYTLTLNQQKEALRMREDDLSKLLVGAKSLTEEIADRVKILDQLDKDIASPPASDNPPQVQKAQILALKVRRQVRASEIELLKKRLASSLLTDLAQSERDLLLAQIAQTEQKLADLKKREQELREIKAVEDRKQAEAEAHKVHMAQLPPEAQEVANSNTSFRQELEGLVAKEQQVNDRLQQAGQQLEELKADFDRAIQRVDVVGGSPAIGHMLRKRRSSMPSMQHYRKESQERVEQISEVTDRQLDIDDLLRQSSTVEQTLNAILQKSSDDKTLNIDEGLSKMLIQARRDSLNELQKVYGRYINKLTSLDIGERQLVSLANTYIAYIDDQLIWIPSSGFMSLFAKGGGLWLLDINNWTTALHDLAGSILHWPEHFVIICCLIFPSIMYRQRILAKLHEIHLMIRKIRTDSFLLSLQALWLTALYVIPLPLTIFGLGRMLRHFPAMHPFSIAVAAGLIKVGLILGKLSFVQALCRNEGLGDRHFGWPESPRMALLKVLRLFKPFCAASVFVVTLTAGFELPLQSQAVGGLAFVFVMLASAVATTHLLGKNGVMKRELLDLSETSLPSQLHFLWLPVAVGLPLILACISLFGYHYTALRLEQQLQMTIWYFFSLLLLRDLILRWLFVTERRLRYENALRKRDELRANRIREDEESSSIAVEIPEVNYDSLSEQSRRLVYAGFLFATIIGSWAIWNDILPTLGFLNSTVLPFHTTHMIDGIPKEMPITLEDLIMGLFFLVITMLAAKNLPGILEISLLQRLPLDAGARYAVTALSQYSIAALGCAIAFGNIGLEWSSIQWLVAALGVGLGFGLQEIVANFVSGIILLFERPIRVGDVVTIDDTTGVVSRIRIRATTITNYDKQELIVPNKQFITGRLVNWTLSDKMNRIIITIGIAYGSDVRKAMELLSEVAAENENVLRDPKPLISFEGFGDNALTLILRCYLANMDNRLSTITAVHLAINDKFTATGISIAFPQRDIHLVSATPIEVCIQRPEAK